MNQILLFEIADTNLNDRPERELETTDDTHTPATDDELKEFFDSMAAMLADVDGRSDR